MNLNPSQQTVIAHRRGPLLIVAGAGTGKTTVLTQTIAHLITKQNISPNQILATTFTQKAAAEMVERLDTVLPLGYEEPMIGTFHSLCDRILSTESLAVGLDPNYQIITPVDQWILVKKNLFKFNLKYYRPLGNPTKFISALLTFFSRIQDENVNPKQISRFLAKAKKASVNPEAKEELQSYQELFGAYQTYQQLKLNSSVMDFGDLLTKTLELFSSRPAILKKYQDQFAYLFIDEFQDTNYAQYEFIKKLAPPGSHKNLIVVGDDDQSVFAFRGAALSNILEFKSDYKKAKTMVLTQNYRSRQPILDAAYRLITQNNPYRLETKLGITKKLTGRAKKPLVSPQIIHLTSSQSEVDYIISQIISLVSTQNYTFKDFAILGRAHSHLAPFAAGLKSAGLPYQLISNRGLFDQAEVRLLLGFLKCLYQPQDDLTLFEFLHFESFELAPAKILSAIQLAKTKSVWLWDLIQADPYFARVVKVIKTYQDQSHDLSVSRLLYNFIIDTLYVKSLTQTETVANSLKIRNLNLLFEKIKSYENSADQPSLVDFLDTLELWQAAGDNPPEAVIEDIDTINLMTVHAAKGLEFPVVFIVNLVTGRFPGSSRGDPITFPDELVKEKLASPVDNIREERRLLYVGMTRAKDRLFLTYADDYGGVRKRHPSGFLAETGLEVSSAAPAGDTNLPILTKPPQPPLATHLDQKGRVEIRSLSYTQIDTFKGCPLKYKYRYLLKIPTLPGHTLTFGRSVHQTLYHFHRLAQQGRALSQVEFIKLFKDNFDDTGYDSEAHKKLRFNQAIKDLKHYYRTHRSLFGQPIHLERSFKLKIGDVIINGTIDRLDQTKNGIEIIDYKTGQPKDQAKVDKDAQLSLYALASTQVFNLKPAKLSLYYLESGQKVTTTRSNKDLAKTQTKLEKDIAAMKTSSFPAKPDKVRCGYCEYNRICPFRVK